jgi:hypothetical protein
MIDPTFYLDPKLKMIRIKIATEIKMQNLKH